MLTARPIAARTAMAIDNALLYRRERLATPALQRHLLPARLPGSPWAQSAHRCLPAQNGTLAGGDWYDTVRLPGGRIGLTVSDVMGHGLGAAAAAAVGRYRSSARALLAVGLEPGQLLTRIDGLDDGSDNDLLATCACAVYDGVTGNLRLALAGHLVLYTDGMIEDRGTSLDIEQGIAMLRRAVHTTEASLDEVCDALMTVRPANSVDDATLLVTRLTRVRPDPA